MGLVVETDQMFKDGMIDAVTYNPVVGDSAAVNAIIDRDSYNQERTPNGEKLMKSVEVLIQQTDISTPDVNGDTVTLDSLDWGVSGFIKHAENAYLLMLVREENISKRARR